LDLACGHRLASAADGSTVLLDEDEQTVSTVYESDKNIVGDLRDEWDQAAL
jgi:hypothetical protein